MSTRQRGSSTRRVRAAVVVLALVGVALASVATPARAATAEVTIANLAFSPETVTVELTADEAGLPDVPARVNFVNRDEGVEHTVLFDDRSVAVGSSGRLSTGQIYTVIFEEPGRFAYQCEIHPNMTGTVVVTPPAKSRDEGDGGENGSGTSVGILVAAGALAAAIAVVAALLVRRRRRSAGSQQAGKRPTRSGGS